MRLGIMLRHFDQHGGGVKVYTSELTRALIEINTQHELVLMFRNPARLGTYSGAMVREVLLKGDAIPYWDHVLVPRAVRRLGIDVLFNPKYSIPLWPGCRTAWVCHGLDWYVMPEASRWIDRLNHRLLVPRYAAAADAIIAVSETTREHVMRYLHVPPQRVHTVYSGMSDAFHAEIPQERLDEVRKRLRLPPRFLLYCGAIYPPKNFTRLIRAYARVGPAQGVPLVIAGGTNRFLSEHELHEPERQGVEAWMHRLGWIDNADLPAIYRLSEGLLLPSLYESFGMPILEAMACDCAVLTSDRYGTREIAAGAAVLVDPESVDAIAAGIDRLLNDRPLRAAIIAAGRERARQFSWRRTAREILRVLESLPEANGARSRARKLSALPQSD